jgi:hypothetical protein
MLLVQIVSYRFFKQNQPKMVCSFVWISIVLITLFFGHIVTADPNAKGCPITARWNKLNQVCTGLRNRILGQNKGSASTTKAN